MSEAVLEALGDLTNGALNYYQTPHVVMAKRKVIETYIDQLQQENQQLKEQKEELTNMVCNKVLASYEYSSPLKDSLNEANLKIIALEESKHITELENNQLKDVLERSYTLEQLDFAVDEVKEQLKVEKDINNNLHKTIDKLRVNLYEATQQLDLYKEVIEEVKELIPKQLLSNVNITKYTDEMCLRDILQILDKVNGGD